jgi:hypothetical protein
VCCQLAWTSVGAQEADAPIVTDRPGNANAALTVPVLSLQIEGSALYAYDAGGLGDAHTLSFPTALRFGVLPFLELRAGSSLLGIRARALPMQRVLHTSDTFVGTKAQVLKNRGAVPDLALMLDVFLPTGSGPFTARVVVPEARAAAAWAVWEGFGVLLNAGVDVPSQVERFARFVYVANFNYAPPWLLDGRISVFVESYGRLSRAAHRSQFIQVDLGAALLVTEMLQLDFFTQHRLYGGTPDLALSIGCSARF